MRKKKALKWFFVSILLATAALLPLFLTQRIRTVHEYLMSSTDKNYMFQELEEAGIVQEFIPEYNKLEEVELFLILLDSVTEGNIRIQIEDPDGKIVCDKKFLPSDISAGEFYPFRLNASLRRGEMYRLHLSLDGTAEELPRVLIARKDENLYETRDMYIGDRVSELNMAVTYHYR